MSSPSTTPEAIRHLPIADVVEQVSAGLLSGNVALHAAPGAGKSTGLPLVLLSNASPANRIILLEPRRLAAMGVAERLALHANEPLGQRIGLRMRGKTLVSNKTCLEVVTEGVLTRMLQTDPTMEGVGLIIFDEFHERSLHADLGLALVLEVQQALRDDLRLLLMSATLDATEISRGVGHFQQISCAGRQFPVDIRWLGNSKDDLVLRVAAAVNTALIEEQGDVLVFLPGVAEIDRTARMIQPRLSDSQLLFQLHGGANAQTQRAATAPATDKHRRVILSTSIAETSITIDGVRVVIDAGLERRGRIDNTTGAQRLETVMASQASATQRSGRAGRTAAGVCYRLWSETDHAHRAASWQPEILRSDLSALVVELGQWGATDMAVLPWLEPPPEAAVARAQTLLTTLGIWGDGRLTDHGITVSRLPVHPRLGHMLLWAVQHGVLNLACKLAAVLEEGGLKSRIVDLELLLQQALPQHIKRRITQLENRVNKLLNSKQNLTETVSTPSLGVLLAQAYPDWIAQRRSGDSPKYVLSCGAGAVISADDPLAHDAWLAVASMGGAAREARVFLACALNINELMDWAPELFTSAKKMEWDDRRERVIAERQKRLGALVVESKTISDISDDEKAYALLNGIRKRGIACLPWNDECRQWQARVQMMSHLQAIENMSRSAASSNASVHEVSANELKATVTSAHRKGENDAIVSDALEDNVTVNIAKSDWPSVDDEALTDQLENWLLVWLHGKSSLKSLSQLDLLAILKPMLDYRQQQKLDTMLPVRYTVPSGSKVKLRYTDGDNPVLSVKLQEMFGCTQNPSVANGKVVLTVELLSPARRPVQLTADLVNFWDTSYLDVKKDMAGRYPKHDWPDDPRNAKPTAYAKRRKR